MCEKHLWNNVILSKDAGWWVASLLKMSLFMVRTPLYKGGEAGLSCSNLAISLRWNIFSRKGGVGLNGGIVCFDMIFL